MALTRRGAAVVTGAAGLAAGAAWLLNYFGLVSTDVTSFTGPTPAKAKAPLPVATPKGPPHKVKDASGCEREFEEGRSNRTKSSNRLIIKDRELTFRGKTKTHTIRFEDDWDLIGWGARDQTCGKGSVGTYAEVLRLRQGKENAVLIDRGTEWVIVVGGDGKKYSRQAARLTKEQFDDLSTGPRALKVYTLANPKRASLGERLMYGSTLEHSQLG